MITFNFLNKCRDNDKLYLLNFKQKITNKTEHVNFKHGFNDYTFGAQHY